MNSSASDKLLVLGRPLSPVYALLMRLRALAYRAGWLPVHRLGRPVISIGNLSMGGTGKTPHVIHVCKLLQQEGLRPAVITRGYGGRAGKGPLVVSSGQGAVVSPSVGGDEPVMMARVLRGIPIVAGSDRVKGARLAVSRLGAEVIVLDDGFQHMRLARDLDIVLLPADSPPGGKRVFPGGELREPLSALKRASCIVLTRAEGIQAHVLEDTAKELSRHLGDIPVFASRNRVSKIWSMKEERTVPASSLGKNDLAVYAFCGLAAPGRFLRTLGSLGARVTGYSWFRDHHGYCRKDLEDLCERARSTGARALVTTAKDAVKLRETARGSLAGMDVLVVEIVTETERGLQELVKETAGRYRACIGRGGGI